ncbi:thiamine phosphate synthase [Pontibacter sp. SGAir0037]|uniref:thiamine phosphate synthase n=1 Tax=Pontibacter sp. SGAir0037 TaxID=2571030 RepID=UPI0010CCF6BE|nr:thiamine phosphate synthase [Pontibacter sp. SGAir0037]QCR24535.1 thiamine phosphate synthase [Pontibacter sp. SGAir0037]
MNLIIVTFPAPFPEEHKYINLLLERGLERLHLRKPGFTLQEMHSFIQQIPAEYHSRLMLHSYHELAQEFEVKGLHFPEALRVRVATTPKGSLLFSTSFHHLQDIKQPQPLFDYAFLSPVFNSISKEGYKAAFAPAELALAVRQSNLPVVALGGIDASNLAKVQELGFAGAAVLGAVWQAEDPLKAFSELQKLV